jgi:pimeloyl-ACP methyl ester carboxylesterase
MPAPEAAAAPAAVAMPEQQAMPAVTAPAVPAPAPAPAMVDTTVPQAPTTAVAPVAPVYGVAPVAPIAPVMPPPSPAAPDQAVMMPPPTTPTAVTPPPSGLTAPEEKKNDPLAPAAAAKPAPVANAVPDYASEQRLASELGGVIQGGEIVSLSDGAQPFMGILTAAEQPRGGVILLPGCGNHPDAADVVHPLRVGLVSKGWTTLSLQMPVLAQTAPPADYIPLFGNTDQRIDAGIALLKQKGISNVVLAAHDCGAHMAMHWLGTKGDSTVRAYVGMGMREVLPLDTVKMPILDVYGEKDLPAALNYASERQRLLQKAGNTSSKQQMLPEADHNFKDKGDALNAVVTTWLNSLPL